MPLTPEIILGLSRKYMEARIFLTAVELDVFSLLAKGPLTADEASEQLAATRRGVALLLDALVPMELLEKRDGRYHCPPEVAATLSKDSPTSMLPMTLIAVGGWRRWSDLTEIVRHGRKDDVPAVFGGEPAEQAAFAASMHAIARKAAPAIAAAVNPGSARRLLDVGGSLGTYAEALLEVAPELHATLFDLPAVIPLARERFAGTKLADRVSFVAGDFYKDELPADHDLALLSAIIHSNSDAQNVELYRKVHRALRSGGRVVIRDHVMSPDHTEPASGTLFAVNMLVGTPGGSTYSFDEIREGLEEAGFTRVKLLQTGERMDGLVEAFKP